MATGTRSLPTDSPGPYFPSISPTRRPTPEGVSSDMNLLMGSPQTAQNLQGPTTQANSDILPYLPSSGIEYSQWDIDQDRLSTYTSLDDYDAMFEARHGRGAIDNVIATGETVSATSPILVPTPSVSMRITKNPITRSMSKYTPSGVHSHSSQQDQAAAEEEYQSPVEHDVVPPVGGIYIYIYIYIYI